MLMAIGKQLDPLINFKNDLEPKILLHEELLDVLVAISGTETVANKLKEARIKRAEENAATQKAELETQLAEGLVVESDRIAENDAVVLLERDEQGNVLPPGWFLLPVPTLKPEIKEQILGKEKGFVGKSGERSFEILGIYSQVTPKAETTEQAGE
jgi:hypothetical protein